MARSRWLRPAWLRGLVAAVVLGLVGSVLVAVPLRPPQAAAQGVTLPPVGIPPLGGSWKFPSVLYPAPGGEGQAAAVSDGSLVVNDAGRILQVEDLDPANPQSSSETTVLKDAANRGRLLSVDGEDDFYVLESSRSPESVSATRSCATTWASSPGTQGRSKVRSRSPTSTSPCQPPRRSLASVTTSTTSTVTRRTTSRATCGGSRSVSRAWTRMTPTPSKSAGGGPVAPPTGQRWVEWLVPSSDSSFVAVWQPDGSGFDKGWYLFEGDSWTRFYGPTTVNLSTAASYDASDGLLYHAGRGGQEEARSLFVTDARSGATAGGFDRSRFGGEDLLSVAADEEAERVYVRGAAFGYPSAIFEIDIGRYLRWMRMMLTMAEWMELVADPVSPVTGSFTEVAEDISSPAGAWGLEWGRVYNSVDPTVGMLGPGWVTPAETTLVAGGSDGQGGPGWLEWRQADGRLSYFTRDGSDWEPPPAFDLDVTALAGGGGWEVASPGREAWRYDSEGRLVQRSNLATGETVSLTWAGGSLDRISSSTGWRLEVTAGVDQGGESTVAVELLAPGATGGSGRAVIYGFSGGRVHSVSASKGADVQDDVSVYGYDVAGHLERVWRGSELVVENTYDDWGRVLSQETPGAAAVTAGPTSSGEVLSFSYTLDTDLAGHPAPGFGRTAATWNGATPGDASDDDTVVYEFDAFGHVTDIQDPSGRFVDRVWGSSTSSGGQPSADFGRLTGFTDRRQAHWAQAFDSEGRLVRRSAPDPDGSGPAPAGTEYFAYVGQGDDRPWITVDAAGTTTTYDYAAHASGDDPDDRVPSRVMVCGRRENPSNGLTTADACEHGVAGTETTAITSSVGLVNQLTDPDGVVSTYHYGSEGGYTGCWGRQLCSETSAGVTTTLTYDPATGQVGSATTEGAGTTTYLYDAQGRPVEVRDPLYDPSGGHHARSFGYDAAGRLLWVSDESNPDADGPTGPDGHLPSVSYTYRPDGQVATETTLVDAGTAATTTAAHAYDSAGRLVSTTVAAGSADAATTTYDHGPLGRLEKITDPTGVVTQLCYDADGNQIRQVLGATSSPCGPTPPAGTQVSATAYDLLGRVSCEAGADVAATATYAASGELDCTSAGITRYSYDPAGRVTRVTRYADTAAESVTESSYDPTGRLSEVRVPPPGLDCYHWETQSTCGANPEVIAPVVAESRTYTPAGNLETVTRPVPHRDEALRADFGDEPDIGVLETVTTRYSYDSAGRLESVADPYAYLDWAADGDFDTHQPTTYSYDAAGRLDLEVTPAGIRTHRSYDGRAGCASRSQLTPRVRPPGWHESTATAPRASWSRSQSPIRSPTPPPRALRRAPPRRSASPTTRLGACVSVTDALTNTVTYAYDARGNRISRSSNGAGGAVTETWSYDPADRLVGTARQRADAAATMQTSVVYDFAYDTQTDPCGLGAAPEPLGRVIARIDDEDRQVCVAYDAAGRIGAETYSGGAGTAFDVAYAYDEAGNPTTVTDTRQPGTWTRSFDLAGGVLAATMPDGTTRTYGRDSWGNLTSLAETRDGVRPTNWLYYDLAGRLQYTGVATGTGDWLSLQIGRYERDPDGRPTAETLIELYWNEGVSIDWDDGTLTHTTGTVPPDDPDWFRYNYSGRYWDYDAAGEVSDYIEVLPEPTGSDPNSYTLDIGYLDRDPAGRITGDLEWVLDYDFDPYEMTIVDYGYTTYGYDHAGQLVSADDGETERAWDYDARGNRISEAVTDAGGTDTTTYGYDAWGRLASATAPGATTAYAYDDSGRRVSETAGSQVVSYGYDPAGMLATRTVEEASVRTEETTRTYLAGLGLTDVDEVTDPDGSPQTTTAHLALDDQVTGMSSVISYDAGDGWRNLMYGDGRALGDWEGLNGYSYDHLGSRRAYHEGETTSTAASYDAWGLADEPAPAGSDLVSFGYRGEVTTDGLVHLRNRVYDPTTGTFLSPDPLMTDPYGSERGAPTEANAYHYVSNDPLNFVDPLGLCRTTDVYFDPYQDGAVVEGPEGGLDWDECEGNGSVTCISQPLIETLGHLAGTVKCGPSADNYDIFGWVPDCFTWQDDCDSWAKQLGEAAEWLWFECSAMDEGCDVQHGVLAVSFCPLVCITVGWQDGEWFVATGSIGLSTPSLNIGAANLPLCEREDNSVGGGAGYLVGFYESVGSDGSDINPDDTEVGVSLGQVGWAGSFGADHVWTTC